MNTIFKASFSDDKGIECDRCMLQGTRGLNLNGETVMACYGLGIRPICPEEGCRKDCPLIKVTINKELVKELELIVEAMEKQRQRDEEISEYDDSYSFKHGIDKAIDIINCKIYFLKQ